MEPLTVEASLDSLSEIGRYLASVSEAVGLSKQEAYGLRLAVDEVATNIIIHGFQDNGLTGTFLLKADQTPEGVTVTLEDTSPEFDPRGREMPTEEDLTTPLEDRNIGGLGIFLAFESVDEFTYERRGDTNVNVFVVKRKTP